MGLSISLPRRAHSVLAYLLPDMAALIVCQARVAHLTRIGNSRSNVPEFFTRFERIAEIVGGDEPSRQAARARFKFYRERGYPIETHELNG